MVVNEMSTIHFSPTPTPTPTPTEQSS